MNRAYKSIYNERTGTFVAVAENVNAKGKPSSSRVSKAGGLVAAVAAGALVMGSALAQVVVDDATGGNSIDFTTPDGSIDFGSGGSISGVSSITGLTGLTVNGALSATSITVTTGGAVAAGNNGVVTGGQLFTTDQKAVAAQSTANTAVTNASTAQARADAAHTALSDHDDRIIANADEIEAVRETASAGWDISAESGTAANVGSGGSVDFSGDGNIEVARTGTNLTFSLADEIEVQSITAGSAAFGSTGLTIDGGPSVTSDGIDAGGLAIINMAPGEVAEGSMEAITGGQVHNYFIEEGATGVRYFRAASTQDDSVADGAESIAIGPNAVTTETAEGAIALGQGATAGGELTGGEAAIAVGRVSSATGDSAMALGDGASAAGDNATALGAGAAAGGKGGLALGNNAVAAAENNISIGNAAGQNTNQVLPGDQSHNIAIGNAAGQDVAGQFNVTMGDQAGNRVDGDYNIALGHGAGADQQGEANVSIGRNAKNSDADEVSVNQAVSIGESAHTTGSRGVSIGHMASAGREGVALGSGARTTGTGVAIGHGAIAGNSGYIALGSGSRAVQSDIMDAEDPSKIAESYLTEDIKVDGVVSVGNRSTGQVRRITNVADGAHDNDAVNVQQLYAAVNGIDLSDPNFSNGIIQGLRDDINENMMHYVSINDDGDMKDNRGNDGALGADSIAIGPEAKTEAGSVNSTAIGYMTTASGASAVVLGHNITGEGANSTTIGNSESKAYGESGIAIGTHVESRDQNSIVIGRDSYTNRQANGPAVDNSIVIGTQSSSTAVEGIVIGKDSVVNAPRGIAQGSAAHATAGDAMAFGTQARASGASSQASGRGASAHRTNAIATGTNATGWANDGIAMGTGAVAGIEDPANLEPERNTSGIAIGQNTLADGYHALAFGVAARATDESATAIGDSAEASAEDALAVGSGAEASAQNASAFGQGASALSENSVAVGSDASAFGVNASAFGPGAEATGSNTLAVGSGARAEAQNASAFGQGTQALHLGSVALGAGSVTGSHNSGNYTFGTYGVAGRTTGDTRTVSVGTAGNERQIQFVAPGVVDANSTDAINGSQLHATNEAFRMFGSDTAGVMGGNAEFDPDTGGLSFTNIGGDNVPDAQGNTINEAITYAAQGWNVSADGDTATRVAPGDSVNFGNTDNNINIARTATGLTFDLAEDIVLDPNGSVTIGDTVINGDTITTNNLTVEGETRLGDNFVVNNAGDVTYNGVEIANQDDGLSFAGNTGGTIDKTLGDTTPLTISGELADGGDATGANLRVDSDGNQLNLVMAQDLTDLNSITINNGGPVISGSGIDMNDNRIVNLAPGEDGTDAVNVDQLTEVSDVANRGWDISTNDGDVETVAPGDAVNFADDGNVLVSNSVDAEGNHTVNVALAEDLTDLNSIGLNGRNGEDGLTIVGGDGSPGTPGLDGADGITRIIYTDEGGNEREVATMDDGLVFAGNTGDDIAKKLGETLTISGELADGGDATGANLRVDSDGNQLNLVMAQDLIDLNSITINNGGPVISGSGIDMNDNRIVNLAPGEDGTDAVNVDQLTEVSDVANRGWDISTNDGDVETVAPGDAVNFADDGNVLVSNSVDAEGNHTVNVELAEDLTDLNSIGLNGRNGQDGLTIIGGDGAPGVGGADGITRIIYTDEGGNEREVATMDDGLSFAGNTGDTIDKALGETLMVSGELADGNDATGANLRVDSDGNQLNLVMARDLIDLNSITINNGGPVISGSGIDMNDNRIINLAPGEDGTDAVNVDQLTEVSDVANMGWNISTDDGAESNVAPGGTVNFGNEDGNINVTQTSEGLSFDLNKDIALGEDGSLTIAEVDNDGNLISGSMLNNEGLSVAGDDGTTEVGAGSIVVADVDGNETTIGGTQVLVGGDSEITIDGGTGIISGLSNQTIDYPEFADGSGRAATEEQLKVVHGEVTDLADTPLTFAGDSGDNVERKLGDTVNLVGGADEADDLTDGNIGVVADGDDTLAIRLNKDIDLGDDGSLTIGNTVMNDTGLTINDTTAGTLASIGSGGIALADNDGNITTLDPTSVTVGGAFPIAISGNTGMISGLQNQSVFYGGFADGSGRAATEEQLGSITNFLDFEEGADGKPVFNYNGQDHTSLTAALDSMHWNVEAPAPDNSGGGSGGSGGNGGSGGGGGSGGNGGSGGGDGSGGGGSTTPIHNTNTLGFVEGDNIVISKTDRPGGSGADIKMSLAQDVTVNSITAIQIDAQNVNADQIAINNGGPVINSQGIDMSGNRITNVAPGVEPGDAVNVGQLQGATDHLQGQVHDLRGDLRRQDRKLSAGVAAAMATAALPQAYLPGKTMMSMAAGTWNSESGMAIGFSGITDNGHWVYKLSGNATSRGDYGGAVGIGYQW